MIERDQNDKQHVVLIDFGFAEKYIDKNDIHISDIELKDSFRGNILFSSLEQMQFKTTSRKDDLVSLCYMIMYLLNEF